MVNSFGGTTRGGNGAINYDIGDDSISSSVLLSSSYAMPVLMTATAPPTTSSYRTINLEGKSPWGFRVVDLNSTNNNMSEFSNSISLSTLSTTPPSSPKTIGKRHHTPLLAVSKVRSSSKADQAGLRENDIIVLINNIPAEHLNLEEAADLIENSFNLCLTVRASSSNTISDASSMYWKQDKTIESSIINTTNTNNNTATNLPSSLLKKAFTSESISEISDLNNTQSTATTTTTTTTNKSLLNNPVYNKFNYNNNSNHYFGIANSPRQNKNLNNQSFFSPDNDIILNHYANNNNNNERNRTEINGISNNKAYKTRGATAVASSSSATSRSRNNYNIYYKNNLKKSYNSGGEEEDYKSSNHHLQPYYYRDLRNSNNSNNGRGNSRNYESDSGLRDSGNSAAGGPEKRLQVSYASITLRQPLKDINYFSDTETVNKLNGNKRSHNRINFITKQQPNLTSSSSFAAERTNNNNHNRNRIIRQQDQAANSIRSHTDSANGSRTSHDYNQISTLGNRQDYNSLLFNSYDHDDNNTNKNKLSRSDYYIKKEPSIFTATTTTSSSNNNNNTSNLKSIVDSSNFSEYHDFSRSERQKQQQQALPPPQYYYDQQQEDEEDLSVENITRMYNNLLASMSNFNRQPHGFSKLNPYGANPASNPPPAQPQPVAIQQPSTPKFVDNNSMNRVNMWNQQQSAQQPTQPYNYLEEDDYEPPVDPTVEKYEREMGTEFNAKPAKANYSDSYFYNSSVFNYPTIDDQKKLAKSIADTLEGSNPATSKYHKKKQNLLKQQYEQEQRQQQFAHHHHHSGAHHYGGSEYGDSSEPVDLHLASGTNSYLYDDSVPDVIKRSIAQATQIDPIRMIQAPDSSKTLHFTEHTSHTQMPPKAAMSLAAALETEIKNGGRGAQIFQKRKAKSEKWVVDETNVKKVPGQQYITNNPPHPPPPPQPVYQPDYFSETESRTRLQQEDPNRNNPNYLDFNAKPKGWGSYPEPTPAPSVSKLSYNPNKLDLDAWNSNNNNQQLYDQHSSSYSVSKDGVQSLKAKLYQPLSPSPAPAGQFSSSSSPNFNQQQRPTHNQSTSRIKLVSQENYLFNSKNAQSQLNPHDVAHDNSHNESNYGKDRYYDGGSFNDYGAYSHSSFNEQVASSDL